MTARILDWKRERVRGQVRIFEQHCEQLRKDMIFELTMQLDLAEATVESVWDESL